MGKIKSLIYREWVLTKKTLLLGLIAALPMLMLGVVVGNGFHNGTLRVNERLHTYLSQTGNYPYTFMVAFFLIIVIPNVSAIYESDIKANWTRYSMTLPADTKSRALAHTLFLLIRIIAAFLLSVAAGTVIAAAFGKQFRAETIADIGLLICLLLIEVCIGESFRSKAKDMITYKKRSNCMAAVFAGLGVAVGLFMARTARSTGGAQQADFMEAFGPLIEKYTAFRNAAAPFIIPVFIGLIVLIYVIGKRNLDSLKQS
ncbi:MAG: ABC-2 transporter permease [Oscillospiraceae bacterium]|nr:ABC-2 transporter permease [Oscillospiraceae bacterium]